MSVKLNDTLINFFSEIEIKFEWNEIFCINIMDHFPLLKQGLTKIDTYYNVIIVYGLFCNFIDFKNIFRDCFTDKLIYKILNNYFDYEEDDEDPFLLTANELTNSEIYKIKYDLNKEYDFSRSLYYNIKTEYGSFYKGNLSLSTRLLFNILTKNEKGEIQFLHRSNIRDILYLRNLNEQQASIRLLSDVLNNNTEDMITAFYIDDIDFYIGYKDLYLLANSKGCIKIAEILKEKIVTQNLYIKQALVISFENVIGPSNIPNIIYDVIK